MDVDVALDRLRDEFGGDLRVLVDVRTDAVDVRYVRDDVDPVLAGVTSERAHESHLRDVAAAMLTGDGTATIRFTPEAIVVGLPRPEPAGTGILLSLDPGAGPAVDEFVSVLIDEGATLVETTVSRPANDDPDTGALSRRT